MMNSVTRAIAKTALMGLAAIVVVVTMFFFFAHHALLIIALAVLGWALWVSRAHWLPTVRRWKAALIARFDKAPNYWRTPATTEDHAGYRADYELLVSKPERSRSELLMLADIIDALHRYGDNPLTQPPQPQGFAGFASAGAGIFGGRIMIWAAVLLLGLCAVLYGRGLVLKAERDRACSSMELLGHTSRMPCLALREAGIAIETLHGDLDLADDARAAAVAQAVLEERETVALNQRNAARARASEARLRRARTDDIESARDVRAPDWDQRLRDLADPVHVEPDGAGAGPAGDPAGGVSG